MWRKQTKWKEREKRKKGAGKIALPLGEIREDRWGPWKGERMTPEL
jgi:hypothetical protein